MTDPKPLTDWERVELEYRAGVLSLREIGSIHGVTEGAIRKRAKRDGWTRDLSAKIKQRADDLVRRQEVRAEVRAGQVAYEREVIESNALRIAQVRGEHRADIARSRTLVLSLLGELEAQTQNVELFEQLGDMLRREDDKGVDKLNDLYQKVISLPGRVDSVKKLTEALKNLIGLEREAYDIEELPKTLRTESGAGGLDLTDDPVEAARRYQQFIAG